MHISEPIPALSLRGISGWVNTHSLDLDSLKGRVIALHFWTMHHHHGKKSLAPMLELARKYRDLPFTYATIHNLENAQEDDTHHLKKFLFESEFTAPVGIDHDNMVWKRYKGSHWPTIFLIDKQGMIRERHIGEGGYHQIEQELIHLLQE